MKKALIFSICFIIVTAAHCNKEGENCHKSFVVVNNSERIVISTGKSNKLSNPELCWFPATYVRPGESKKLAETRGCLEHRYSTTDTFQAFFLDTVNYVPYEYFGCDTIQEQYVVLKKKAYTYGELKNLGFKYIYP